MTAIVTVYGIPAPQGNAKGPCVDRQTGRFTARHGGFGTPEYSAWRAMIKRCTNARNASYARYGARGITVCQRWLDSFENFIFDMGRRPSDKHSLDRIDNNAGYGPDNCRWATATEQQCNRSSVIAIEHNGQTFCVAEWSRRTGIPASTIKQRIRLGWNPVDAITKFPDRRRATRK